MRGMEAPGVEPMDQSEVYTATALCTVEVPAVPMQQPGAGTSRWQKSWRREARALRDISAVTHHTSRSQIPDPIKK